MVTFIEESEQRRMSLAEIEKEYAGKWVYAISADDNSGDCIPVVVASVPFEGREQGIYKQLEAKARAEGKIMACIDLWDGLINMPSSYYEIF
jgi:hypothetical protein